MSGSGGEIHVEAVGVGAFVFTILFLVVICIVVRLIYRVIIRAMDRSEAGSTGSYEDFSISHGRSDNRASTAQSGVQPHSKQYYDIRPQGSPDAKDAHKRLIITMCVERGL